MGSSRGFESMLKIIRHCKIRLMGSMDGISSNKNHNHIQKAHHNVRKKIKISHRSICGQKHQFVLVPAFKKAARALETLGDLLGLFIRKWGLFHKFTKLNKASECVLRGILGVN
jgi:hypothetical protein